METLYESIAKYQNKDIVAMYYENKKINYKTLISNIHKMVNYLREEGIKEGDVVTLVLPNVPSCIYAFYALNAIGAIENILHPLTPLPKIIESMEKTKSKVLITLGTLYQEINKNYYDSDIKFFLVNPMYDNNLLMRKMFYLKFKKPKGKNIYNLEDFRKHSDAVKIKHHDSSQNSIYLHSGGTTGNSKIIALSDESFNNLSAKVDGIIDDLTNKSMLAVLPTFHGFGLGMGIHAPLSQGATLALMMKFNLNKIIKYINQNKFNYIIGIPHLYEKLLESKKFLNSKLENLDYCFVGGDNVSVKLIERFNKTMAEHHSKAKMYEGYGLTETVTVCCVNTKKDYKIASVGKPIRGIEIKIKNDDLEDLPVNEVGEIFISGNTLMNEYLFDSKTIKETLLNIDGKTWVRTGDMGYLDEEGFLFIKGRKKRIIIISGYNVYPNEVEKVAMENDKVFNATLVYFEKDKPHTNLYIIKNKDSIISDEELRNEIMAELRANFIKYSLPSKIIFMEKFPRTSVGKIDTLKFIDE